MSAGLRDKIWDVDGILTPILTDLSGGLCVKEIKLLLLSLFTNMGWSVTYDVKNFSSPKSSLLSGYFSDFLNPEVIFFGVNDT